jgi:hypothetical protein
MIAPVRRFLPLKETEHEPKVGGKVLTFEEASKPRKKTKPSPARSRKACAVDLAKPLEELFGEHLLVVTHARLYEAVYGVFPSDVADSYAQVLSAARSLFRAFDSDEERAYGYLKWVWQRELKNKKWLLREKKEHKTPPTWRRIFSTRDLVDAYRSEAVRREKS